MKKYSSSDFYLSAVCLACDCTITKLEKKPGNYVEFVFNDSPDKCLQIITSYWAGELLVDPKKLISAINQLKTRIHEGN
jgi:hypothetical protein